MDQFADDVLDYLFKNELASVAIFGYSMGGYVALYLAKNHPDKVDRIVTLATKFLWTPEIAQREINMLDPEKIAGKIPAFARQLEQRHQPNDWKDVLAKTAAMMVALGNDNPLQMEDYENTRHQILVCIGDSDQMVTLEETIAVYRKLPHANLAVLPATIHPIEKIQVERLKNEIIQFLN